MGRRKLGVRAWYAGKIPPDESVLEIIEAASKTPQILFDNTDGEPSGEDPGLGKRLYNKMDSLKRNPKEFRTWSFEDGMTTFFTTLLDLTPDQLRPRVQLLQQLGVFKFLTSDGPTEKKNKIQAIFDECEEENIHLLHIVQANRLAAIWSPKPDTLLDFIINQPALAGRTLADRLNPVNAAPIRFIGHALEGVRSSTLQSVAAAKVCAFERSGEVHVLTALQPVLEKWDEDASMSGCEQIVLYEALLLHELVEVILDEQDGELEPLGAHIVATTFERFLKDNELNIAVEDFFLDWPPQSLEEQQERQEVEMRQQLEAMQAFLQEEVPEDRIDEVEIDDLPLDTDVADTVKKKKTVKKIKK